MLSPDTIDLGAVTGGDKGLDMIIADKCHEGRELVLREERLYLRMFFSAIAALYLI